MNSSNFSPNYSPHSYNIKLLLSYMQAAKDGKVEELEADAAKRAMINKRANTSYCCAGTGCGLAGIIFSIGNGFKVFI